jgi:hypothetical protein
VRWRKTQKYKTKKFKIPEKVFSKAVPLRVRASEVIVLNNHGLDPQHLPSAKKKGGIRASEVIILDNRSLSPNIC